MVLRKPEVATDARFASNALRSSNRDALRRVILDAFSSLTAETVTRLLEEAAIANANINDLQAVWDHPQLKARSRWTEIKTPAGVVPALFPPGMGKPGEDGFAAKMDAVPAVGEHNEAILRELGIGD